MSPIIDAILKRQHHKIDLSNGATVWLRPITNGDIRESGLLPDDLKSPFLWSRSLVDESGTLLIEPTGNSTKDAERVRDNLLDHLPSFVMIELNEAYNVVNKFTKQETIEKKSLTIQSPDSQQDSPEK